MTSPIRIHVVACLAVLALPAAPAGAQAPPWAGWARCQITVTGPGYNDTQTHTWTIAGGGPTAEGAFSVYAATWSVVGGGSLQRTQGNQSLLAQWARTVPGVSAPIAFFVRASDQRMFIQARHAQLRAAGSVNGFQQLTIDGTPQPPGTIAAEAFEWSFPVIEVAAAPTSLAASGSSSPPVTGSVGLMQPAGSQGTASCSWQFAQGSPAPAPPPALVAQAIPTPPVAGAGTAAPTPANPPATGTATVTPTKPVTTTTPGATATNPPSNPATTTPGPPPATIATGPPPGSAVPAGTATSPGTASSPVGTPSPASGLPTTAQPLPSSVSAITPPSQGFTAVNTNPCVLRGPTLTGGNRVEPNVARLTWTQIPGATGYIVAHATLGVLTPNPLTMPGASVYFVHRALFGVGAQVFTITALYSQGCGETHVSLPSSARSPTVTFTNGPGPGEVGIRWQVTGSYDVSGAHIDGPGLPPGGRDTSAASVSTSSYSRGSLTVRGVPAGQQTWTVTAYWAAATGRVTGPPVSASTTVP